MRQEKRFLGVEPEKLRCEVPSIATILLYLQKDLTMNGSSCITQQDVTPGLAVAHVPVTCRVAYVRCTRTRAGRGVRVPYAVLTTVEHVTSFGSGYLYR